MASFMAIIPFFEPGAPPPTLPIPLAQMEIGTLASIPCKLLAQEEISQLHDISRPDVPSDPNVSAPCKISVPSTQPASRRGRLKSKSPVRARHKSLSMSSESSQSDVELEDSDSDTDDDQIPKPSGEAGRPGRGGYNLEDTLHWDPKEFTKLKVCTYNIPCEGSFLAYNQLE
jgi:hypothetical protein